MDEFLYVVAAPFKQHAASLISIRDFEFALSFGLKWMSPENASKVRDTALGLRLLKIDGNKLVPTFDLGKVEIPRGFRPSEKIFHERPLIEQIMAMIVACSGMDNRNVIALISRKQESLGDMVDIEVAALVVAREVGCDISKIYPKVLADMFPNMK
ncbi:DUF2240 family protein [Methanomethylovorans sp.]|uniref:DUF2240 family protein n=1 Tax=Methanomethylovorans sp. TaxID=2758717 RepID=UPI00351BEECE